ncbi:MAG: NTP transferase domain-containing protein [Clostridia bacterium]|nr:NTP transferase domain-containing protein [Clostridia bacterium]
MKPTLVIMAAGLGSRFGGCKQLTPVDDAGHVIIDYSIFDAVRAGFGKVVCIIKKEMEQDFREAIGNRISRHVDLEYAYQASDNLPEGFSVPEGRVKPWGTGHAVICAADKVDGPFAAINADDFYGAGAFKAACDFLMSEHDANDHAMVGYRVENTLTENGTVSRGVCEVKDGMLTGITERTKLVPREGGAAYIEADGETFIPAGTRVSMNMWAFSHSMMDELQARFAPWLEANLPVNPLKCEYYLPLVPNALINEKKGRVFVVDTDEKWFGVTYADDLAHVKAAINAMRESGKYPKELWP